MRLTGHYQNAYVTHDLDRALMMVGERYGLTGWSRFEAEVRVNTPHGETTMQLRLASTWAGGTNHEFVQPLGGADEHYRSMLPPDPADPTPRLHHWALRRDDLAAMRAELAASGMPFAFGGESPAMVFAYMDARASLGHYLEYVWKAEGGWQKIGWPAGKPAM